MPELRVERLRALVAVARTGGFSRAARSLQRTQSSVSQAIASLEEDVGELLVVRDSRRVALTEAGAVLADHGARVLAALDEARAALSSLRHVTRGTLSLGTSDTFAVHLLPPVLATFRSRYPHVDLRLDNRPSPDVAVQVGARRLDVGVVSLPLPQGLRVDDRALDERVRIRRLLPLSEVAILAPDHDLARRRRVTIDQLAAHPLILLDRSTAARAHLDRVLARRRQTPRVVMEMNSIEVIKRLVSLGFGASIVPQIACRGDAERGELVAVPIAGLGRERAIGLVLPAPGPPTRAASAFVAIADEMLSEMSP